MSRRAEARRAHRLAAAAAALWLGGGCGPLDGVGGADGDAGLEDDPLAISDQAAPGSLDDIHRRVIVRSCAGQPGLCHAGQFEPNMSTPALFYENLVNAQGLEIDRSLRVRPGNPGDSLLIHKLRYLEDVGTRMPLGADPLPEEEIAEIEAWIDGGALRRPGADPPPIQNHAPYQPEIAVFSPTGVRLDTAGQVAASPDDTLTLRMSVDDFETDDEDVLYALFFVQLADGRRVVLSPGTELPGGAFAVYDASPPAGAGDLLNWAYDWTIPATVDLLDGVGGTTSEPSAGLNFTILAYYVDEFTVVGMPTFSFSVDLVRVE